jgi:NlpC/P60 family putative phage cell wall peptidase
MIEAEQVVAAAKEWLGTPYLHQAAKKKLGCDCLGLILGVGRELGVDLPDKVPPYSASWRDPQAGSLLQEQADHFLKRQSDRPPCPGDILLFRMRRDLPAKHCAILTTTDQMIHAQEGVGTIQLAFDAPWQRRLAAHYTFPN